MDTVWLLLDIAASSFNHAAGIMHMSVESYVTSDPLMSWALTTVTLAAIISTTLTLSGVLAWLFAVRPCVRLLFGARKPARTSGSAIPMPPVPRSQLVTQTPSGKPSGWCRRQRPQTILKVRVAGESMWHRLVAERSDLASLAALQDIIRRKLAAAAQAEPDGRLQGLSATDISGGKIARLLLMPDILLSESRDVATLRPADELEVTFKL
jgi:hypothetical protein